MRAGISALARLPAGQGFKAVLQKQNRFFFLNNLKLSLYPDKIIIKRYHQGIDFLGYISFPGYRILRTKTRKRMFKKIKQKINSESFEQTFQSYLGVLKHCNGYKIKEEIINILRIKLYGR